MSLDVCRSPAMRGVLDASATVTVQPRINVTAQIGGRILGSDLPRQLQVRSTYLPTYVLTRVATHVEDRKAARPFR